VEDVARIAKKAHVDQAPGAAVDVFEPRPLPIVTKVAEPHGIEVPGFDGGQTGLRVVPERRRYDLVHVHLHDRSVRSHGEETIAAVDEATPRRVNQAQPLRLVSG